MRLERSANLLTVELRHMQEPDQNAGLPGRVCAVQGRGEYQGGGAVVELAHGVGDVRAVAIG